MTPRVMQKLLVVALFAAAAATAATTRIGAAADGSPAPSASNTPDPVGNDTLVVWERFDVGSADEPDLTFDIAEGGYALVAITAERKAALSFVVTVNGPFLAGNRACDEGFWVQVARGQWPRRTTMEQRAQDDSGDASSWFSAREMLSAISDSSWCEGPPQLALTVRDTGDDAEVHAANDTGLVYYMLIESRAPALPANATSYSTCSASVFVREDSVASQALMWTGMALLLTALALVLAMEVWRSVKARDLVRANGYQAPVISPLIAVPMLITDTITASLSRAVMAFDEKREQRRRDQHRSRRAAASAVQRRGAGDAADHAPLAAAEMDAVRGFESSTDTGASAAASPNVMSMSANSPAPLSAPAAVASAYVDGDSSEGDTCRVCKEGDQEEELVAPCRCTGSLKFTHRSCLQRWRLESVARNPRYISHCEVCQGELDPSVVPSTGGPTLARVLADRGVRLAVFVLVTFLLMTIVGAISTETAGRASCREGWHNVDDSFVMMFLSGAVVVTVLAGIVQLCAYSAAVQHMAATLRAGRAPVHPEIGLLVPSLVRALFVVLFAMAAGMALGQFLYLTTDRSAQSVELRLGNGTVLVGCFALLVFCVARCVLPAPQETPHDPLPPNQDAPLLAPGTPVNTNTEDTTTRTARVAHNTDADELEAVASPVRASSTDLDRAASPLDQHNMAHPAAVPPSVHEALERM